MGSVSGFRVVRGDFGVDLVVEREAVMVEFWPRLGTRIGGGSKGVGCSGVDEREEEEEGCSAVGRGGSSSALCSLDCLLSLGQQKADEGEWRGGFIRS